MKSRSSMPFFIAFFIVLSLGQVSAGQTGDFFPDWEYGYLDIHHISTGRGDAIFFMMPDGTNMLVDAGAISLVRPNTLPRLVEARPDDSRTPGDWISRYISHVIRDRPEKIIDYMLATHFHTDHIGGLYPGLETSSSGNYILTGVTEVGERIPFRKVIDRAWPDYDWPVPLDSDYVLNYRKFLTWQRDHNQLEIERFRAGSNDQLVLLHDPGAYPDFTIRNIAANGEIWTGVESTARSHFPPLEFLAPDIYPSENMCSIAFRLSYGKFDYFTGGDLIGVNSSRPGFPDWHDVETPVAKAVGPVDVNVLNHHGNADAQNEFFLSTLRPRVHIMQAWFINQPGQSTLARLLSERLYPGPRDIFTTSMREDTRLFLGANADRMSSRSGHIVVRVEPGGKSYKVYILDDSNERFEVISVHGPYLSR